MIKSLKHWGPCPIAPPIGLIGPIGDLALAFRSFFCNFSKFLQWVVLMVKSLKHRGPCPIAPVIGPIWAHRRPCLSDP